MDYKFILMIVLGYIIGSIPWALIIGKTFYGIDIRNEGSKNLGGTNAGRVLGKKAGISVILLDGLKAFVIMLIANKISPASIIYTGLAACFGHCFPLFANFKGGKAVATSFGFILAISYFNSNYYLFLLTLLVFIITLYLFKMVSLSSLISLFSSVIFSIILKLDISISISLLLLFLFVTYRHKENIKRIIKKEEKRITWL